MNKRGKTVQKAAHPKYKYTIKEVLRRQHYGRSIHIFSGKSTQLAASLKCLYTKACSMDNKQEEFEACV